MTKYIPLIVIGIGVIAAMIAAIPNTLAIFEQPSLSYQNSPFPVVGPVHAGDPIPMTVQRCNHSDKSIVFVFSRTMTNVDSGAVWALVGNTSEAAPGCHELQSRLNLVPVDVPPGRYVLSGNSILNGRYRDFNTPWETEPFDVVPADPVPTPPATGTSPAPFLSGSEAG